MKTLSQSVSVEEKKPFPKVYELTNIAKNILNQRYFINEEEDWESLCRRVVNYVCTEERFDEEEKELLFDIIYGLYALPNSPCLVNAGKEDSGLSACFVVDFKDTLEEIYKTKLEFALVAKKGGGCGTTLTKLRPKNSIVNGSTHGYAGGPVDFYDTICKEMEVLTQAGFRKMAMMGTMSIYHPDILRFLYAKYHEGKMTTTNLSITVDDKFMDTINQESSIVHVVKHKKWGEGYLVLDKEEGKYYPKLLEDVKENDILLTSDELFEMITDNMWRNGEPGIIFYNRVNNSPYKHTNQEIKACNVCGEQPLPPNGSCNLMSIDISKFLTEDNTIDLLKLELVTRYVVRFLDSVIDVNSFPTKDMRKWADENRTIGVGLMGYADLLLKQGIEYGSEKSMEILEFVMNYIYKIAEDESIKLGKELGIPKECKKLPVPRRNITLLTIAPTGTVSLFANCSSGIEPIFSELTTRKDETGTYQIEHKDADKEYFKCAVSKNGSKEVTWEEHLLVLNSAQKFVDSGVSKTINCPIGTHKETIKKIVKKSYELPYIKGLTVYRNGSRKKEVLSPKNLKKDLCPHCKSEMKKTGNCSKCTNPECQFSYCEA